MAKHCKREDDEDDGDWKMCMEHGLRQVRSRLGNLVLLVLSQDVDLPHHLACLVGI